MFLREHFFRYFLVFIFLSQSVFIRGKIIISYGRRKGLTLRERENRERERELESSTDSEASAKVPPTTSERSRQAGRTKSRTESQKGSAPRSDEPQSI